MIHDNVIFDSNEYLKKSNTEPADIIEKKSHDEIQDYDLSDKYYTVKRAVRKKVGSIKFEQN